MKELLRETIDPGPCPRWNVRSITGHRSRTLIGIKRPVESATLSPGSLRLIRRRATHITLDSGPESRV
jgi:hypothetical protein